MKVFGESRKQSKENILCPLCRHDWGDLALVALKKEIDVANCAPNVHKHSSCAKCQTKPIRSARYLCVQCKRTNLCERCFSECTSGSWGAGGSSRRHSLPLTHLLPPNEWCTLFAP